MDAVSELTNPFEIPSYISSVLSQCPSRYSMTSSLVKKPVIAIMSLSERHCSDMIKCVFYSVYKTTDYMLNDI